MSREKIYLAGPLFTSAEREWNVRLARLLEAGGLEIWLPQEHEPRELSAKTIFEEDVKGIDWADVIVAIMDGSDPDSGTCWEVGYGYAKKKLIVLVRTDFRSANDGMAPYNLMLIGSADSAFSLPLSSVNTVAEHLIGYFRKR
jgi:nucleoside 2-deoxyribosyltransferase